MQIAAVTNVVFREGYTEVYLQNDMSDEMLKSKVESCGKYRVLRID